MSNSQDIIPLYEVDEEGKVKVNVPKFLSEREKYSRYTDEQKAEILEIAFAVMEDGRSLELVGNQLGISPSVILGWIGKDAELEDRYERQKKLRARALVEGCLHRLQSSNSLEELKKADLYSRHVLKIAALLRPDEFSDRKDRQGTGGGGGVTFSLTFTGSPAEQPRVIEATRNQE